MTIDPDLNDRCSICRRTIPRSFEGTHNPQPIIDNPRARCCERCNEIFVIPTRLCVMRSHFKRRRKETN